MRRFTGLFILLFLFIFANLGEAKSPCFLKNLNQQESSAYCLGRQFEKQVKKINAKEPQLIRDKNYRDLQAWTLDYTKTANQFKIARLVMTNPQMGNINTLLKEYTGIAKMISSLWSTLPENIDLHGSQFSEKVDFLKWQSKSLLAVETMFPESYANDSLIFPEYSSHNCEYITPGLNALWFGVNALEVLDKIGYAKYGDQWVSTIRSVKAGLPYKQPKELTNQLKFLLDEMGTAYEL